MFMEKTEDEKWLQHIEANIFPQDILMIEILEIPIKCQAANMSDNKRHELLCFLSVLKQKHFHDIASYQQ